MYLHGKGEDGHPEGNIDAYAVMKLSNESEIANNISKWLDNKLGFRAGHALDLYPWRVLSGEANASILFYPDEDLRYQKTLDFQGKKVKGVGDFADNCIRYIWADGAGQLACAFYEAGDWEKGNFYANQMDSYLIEETIEGKRYLILPSKIMHDGDDRGTISCAAWYIFAKNQFNPMRLVYSSQNQCIISAA